MREPTGGGVGKEDFGLGDAGFAGGGIFCAVDDDAEGTAFQPGFAGEVTDGDARQLERHRGQGSEGGILADPAQPGGGVEEDDGFLIRIGGGSRLDLFREGEDALIGGAAEEVFAGTVDGGFHGGDF